MPTVSVNPSDNIPVIVAGLAPGDTIIFTQGIYNLSSNIFKGDVNFYLNDGAVLKGTGDLFVGTIGGDFTLRGRGDILSGNIDIVANQITFGGTNLISTGVINLLGSRVGIDFFSIKADWNTSGQVSANVYYQQGAVTHTPGKYGLPASFTLSYIDGGSFKTQNDICFLDLHVDGLLQGTDFLLLDKTVGNVTVNNSISGAKVQLDGSAAVKLELKGKPPVIEFFDETSNLTVTGSITDTLYSSQDQGFALKDMTIVADGYCLDSAFPINVGIDETVSLNSSGQQINEAMITLIQTSGTLVSGMTWFNEWNSIRIDPYPLHGVVRDGDWTMVANKPTTDRPAPQPSGDPVYDQPDPQAWTEQSNASVVYTGTKYTFTKSGWVSQIQVAAAELTTDTNYRVVILDITNPAVPISSVSYDPVLVEGEWATIAVGADIVPAGSVWLVYIDVLNSGSDTIVTGGWRYDGTSNSAAPAAQGWNRRNNNAAVRIDKTDLDSVDRSSELLGVIPGSTIQIVETATPTNSLTYEVTGTTDSGSDVEYDTNLIDSNGSIPTDAVCTITITIPVPAATKYLEVANFWPANQPDFADTEGYLAFDGVEQTVPDNAYGVRIRFTEAYISPDWDLLAYSAGTGGGGGGGGGEAPTGLERIDEGNGLGWRLIGRSSAQFGNIGEGATDVSNSTGSSSTRGATGAKSFAAGEDVIASGTYAASFGLDNNNAGPYGFAAGTGNAISGSGIGAAVFGASSQANALGSFAAGLSAIANGSYSSAFGNGAYTYTPGGMAIGLFNTGSLNDILFQIGMGADDANRADALTVRTDGRVVADSLTDTLIEGNAKSLVTREWAQKKNRRNFKTETGTVTLTSMQGTDLDFLDGKLIESVEATATVRFASAPTSDVRVEFRIFYGSSQFQSVYLIPSGAFIDANTSYVARAKFNNYATGWNITIIEVAVKELNSPSGVNASYLRLDVDAVDMGNQ